jgi:hypothetical protein
LLLPIYGGLVVLDANTATAVAAVLALVGAALTLGHTDSTARRSRTAEYRSRWDHPEFFPARVTTGDFLSAAGAEDERWDAWNEWVKTATETDKRLHIVVVLNFWEEVASAYNQNLLDNEWFQTDLAWQLKHNWDRSAWFISRYRRQANNVNFWSEWQVAVAAVEADLDRQTRDGEQRATEARDDEPELLNVDQPHVVFRA